MKVIIATDCGSTTTKAILIEWIEEQQSYRQTFRGEAPTTVEAPFEDVTRGVLNAIAEVEELSGRKILNGDEIITPAQGKTGVDIYVSTSSAGGGLQMLVAGAVKAMSAESAQRAALGAGAIVMDTLASNDGRLPHEKIERIRNLRPDMILLSGGTDGGTVSHVVEMAEFIAAADPRPRLGMGYRLPVIYAGNKGARDQIQRILGEKTALTITDNLRPALERENLFPARLEIQKLFLEHVMAQAPGYKKLMAMTGAPIMPTPAAVGVMIQTIAKRDKINVLGVDIGGATTDVFSVFSVPGERGAPHSGGDDSPIFNRTVSANLGMSYSVSNVMARAGIDNVLKWVTFETNESDLRDSIKNKMIRPTTIPQSLEDLMIEQALSREALRGSMEEHRALAVGLKGVQTERTISDALGQSGSGGSIVDMMRLDLIVGSGGVLSHAPRRQQSLIMMLDAFEPEGVTRLAVDSIFMAPHLGVLSTVNARAASEVFEKDCLIYLGSAIAPKGTAKDGARCVTVRVKGQAHEVPFGELRLVPLGEGESADVEIEPAKGFDVGAGPGKTHRAKVHGGTVGLVIDTRGRPLQMSADKKVRYQQLMKWAKALDLYPAGAGAPSSTGGTHGARVHART
jgi:uncharacterized protein (TIGR01319 family)